MFFLYVFGGKISASTLPIVPIAGIWSSPLTIETDDTGRILRVEMSWQADINYPQNAEALGPTDCLVYESQQATIGDDPETDDGTNWKLRDWRNLYADGTRPLTGNLDFANFRGVNVPAPVLGTHLVNKAYVDAANAGLRNVKDAVRLVSAVANIALTGVISVDGVNSATGDRIGVVAQTLGEANGIYIANDAGAWTRATDADTSAEVTSGMAFFVTGGLDKANSGWLLTTADPIVLDTTVLTFARISSLTNVVAGDGLAKTGDTLAVNVDGATLEISTDTLRVKDGGITAAKLAFAYVDFEVPAGAVDGVNLDFTTAHTPIAGSSTVFLNTTVQFPTADFTVAGAIHSFVAAPQVGDVIRISYRYLV